MAVVYGAYTQSDLNAEMTSSYFVNYNEDIITNWL